MLKIVTNNVPRDIIYGYELSETERAEFGYLDWEDQENGNGCFREFFRYKGQLYDLGDIPAIRHNAAQDELIGWDGFASDSFYSGIAIRYPRDDFGIDHEHVIVALVLAD